MHCNVRSGLIRQCHVVMSCRASASFAMSCVTMSRHDSGAMHCNSMCIASPVMLVSSAKTLCIAMSWWTGVMSFVAMHCVVVQTYVVWPVQCLCELSLRHVM